MSQSPARAHKPSFLIKSLMFSGTFVCWGGSGGQKLAGSRGLEHEWLLGRCAPEPNQIWVSIHS